MKRVTWIVALLLTAAAVLAVSTSSAPPQVRTAATPAVGYTLTGMDAHDGTILKYNGTYYLYGTRYSCPTLQAPPGAVPPSGQFVWQQHYAVSTFCGFGVWTSAAIGGPWAYQGLLWDPMSTNPYHNENWQQSCSYGGNGCFNARMIQRWDGVWILFFNVPGDTQRGENNAYYVMGCNGPAGPCGAGVGGYGSTRKMPMNICTKSGDYSVFADGSNAYLVCSGSQISIEQLDYWWTSGSSSGVASIANLSPVEAPGIYKAADGTWVLTVSDPECGYCAGTGLSYAYSSSGPLGNWRVPGNTGWSAPNTGRSKISGTSCGGQPRTAFVLDGQPYEWIDTWYGSANETNADIRLEPLVQTGSLDHAVDGHPWAGGFAPLQCG